MIKINKERILYALIGVSWIVWVWPYTAYRILAWFGKTQIEEFDIHVSVGHNTSKGDTAE